MGSFAPTAIYYDCDVWDGFHDSLPSLHLVWLYEIDHELDS